MRGTKGNTLGLMEPEDLLQVVNEAVEGGFVTEGSGCLDLYMGALALVKERIFTLVSNATTGSGGGGGDTGGAANNSSKSKEYGFDEGEEMTLPNKTNKKRKRRKKVDGEWTDDTNDGVAMNLSLVHYARQSSSSSSSSNQEIEDLLEELRVMYDTTDHTLRKKFTGWTEGRAKLLLERAVTEAYVITPMMQFFQRKATDDDIDDGDDEMGENGSSSAVVGVIEDKDEAVKWFEKLVRVHQPPHPTSWRTYIRYVIGRAGTTTTTTSGGDGSNTRTIGENPGVTMARLRCVRGLYHRAMTTIKKPKRRPQVDDNDDGGGGVVIVVDNDEKGREAEFDAALMHLCEEYTEFERRFGSEDSLASALKSTKGKLLESLVHQPTELEMVSRSIASNASLPTVVVEGGGGDEE